MAVAPPDPPPPSGSCSRDGTGASSPATARPCAPDAAPPGEDRQSCLRLGSAPTLASADAMVIVNIPFPSVGPLLLLGRRRRLPSRTRTIGVGRFHHLALTFQAALHPDMGWDWRAGTDICAPEIIGAVPPASGWLANILCYTPSPPTQEQDASISSPCHRRSRAAGTGRPARCWATSAPTRAPRRLDGQFHAEKMGYNDDMVLLQGRR